MEKRTIRVSERLLILQASYIATTTHLPDLFTQYLYYLTEECYDFMLVFTTITLKLWLDLDML